MNGIIYVDSTFTMKEPASVRLHLHRTELSFYQLKIRAFGGSVHTDPTLNAPKFR